MTDAGRSTEARVTAIIANATFVPLDRLTPDARPEDLGIDSMGLVEVIFALEEAFGIKVPFGAHHAASGLDVSTIGSITAGVRALVAAAQAA